MSPSTAQELAAEPVGTVQNAASGAAGSRGTVGTASFVRVYSLQILSPGAPDVLPV